MIQVACKCGKKYQVDDSKGGSHVKCPECHATFAIPKASPQATTKASSAATSPQAGQPSNKPSSTATAPQPDLQPNKGLPVGLIGVGVMAVASLVLSGMSVLHTPGATAPSAATPGIVAVNQELTAAKQQVSSLQEQAAKLPAIEKAIDEHLKVLQTLQDRLTAIEKSVNTHKDAIAGLQDRCSEITEVVNSSVAVLNRLAAAEAANKTQTARAAPTAPPKDDLQSLNVRQLAMLIDQKLIIGAGFEAEGYWQMAYQQIVGSEYSLAKRSLDNALISKDELAKKKPDLMAALKVLSAKLGGD